MNKTILLSVISILLLTACGSELETFSNEHTKEVSEKYEKVEFAQMDNALYADFYFSKAPTKMLGNNALNSALYVYEESGEFDKLIVRIGEIDGPKNKYGTFTYDGEWDKEI